MQNSVDLALQVGRIRANCLIWYHEQITNPQSDLSILSQKRGPSGGLASEPAVIRARYVNRVLDLTAAQLKASGASDTLSLDSLLGIRDTAIEEVNKEYPCVYWGRFGGGRESKLTSKQVDLRDRIRAVVTNGETWKQLLSLISAPSSTEQQSISQPPGPAARSIANLDLNAEKARRRKLRDEAKQAAHRRDARLTNLKIAHLCNQGWTTASNVSDWLACLSKAENAGGIIEKTLQAIIDGRISVPSVTS